MKKLLALLLSLCLMAALLPAFAAAEEELPELPEGYRWENMGDFLLPVAPNAIFYPYAPGESDSIVAELLYLDVTDPDFQPFMYIWWMPNNMSAYLKRVHPLDYAKELTKVLSKDLTEMGCTVEAGKAVYGMCRNDVFYMLCSMHIADGSIYADVPHDLWVYQRWYGTYDMGTYYFEIYGPTRESVEAIVKDVEQVIYVQAD